MEPKWKHHTDQFQNQIKKNIVEVTKRLVLERGITNVTIVDITKEAGISRVTFYKHYSSIHEIALDIQMRILSDMADLLLIELSRGQNSAEKIQNFLHAFTKMYAARREDIRFIAIFDYTYNATFPLPEVQEIYKGFILDLRSRLAEILRGAVQQGDAKLVFLTSVQSIWGLMQRLVIAKSFSDEDSLQQEVHMLNTLTSILLQSLIAR